MERGGANEAMRILALVATLLVLGGAAVAVIPFTPGMRDPSGSAQPANDAGEFAGDGRNSEALRDQVARLVAAIAEAAQAEKPHRKGDQLTDHYIRAAAAAALQETDGEPARAFVVALGFGLDDTNTLARQPVVKLLLDEVESPEEQAARRKALGKPTVHGRNDLVLHFAISATLTGLVGAPAAEAFGVHKEIADARGKERGRGSGFSFADLAADYAGIELAEVLLEDKADARTRLRWIADGFRSDEFFLDPSPLKEGLPYSAWEEEYGGVDDARYQRAVEALREKIRARPGWAKLREASEAVAR